MSIENNLKSTHYEAIIKAKGGSVYDLPDSLETTYLKRIAELGGGGASSWNDLTDKPFGDETLEPIVWDGNTDGCEIIDIYGVELIKLSDKYHNKTDLVGGIVSFDMSALGGTVLEMALKEDECVLGSEIGAADEKTFAFHTYDGNAIAPITLAMSVHSTETITFTGASGLFDVTVTEGLYVMCGQNGMYFPTTLTFPSQVKPLDEKYMPILTSPSGKKFKITVDDTGVISATEVTA